MKAAWDCCFGSAWHWAHVPHCGLRCLPQDVGHTIAQSLVENKLAACVNIIPGVESVYWWDGKVNTDAELILKIKTRSSLVPALTAHVKSLHPYDECEVTAVNVAGGSESYLKWVVDSTDSGARSGPAS